MRGGMGDAVNRFKSIYTRKRRGNITYFSGFGMAVPTAFCEPTPALERA
jgi:hypothetical protein